MGRARKIPMAKRETAEQRAVTFTKRRQGLFNKAADLCRICDAQIAIMVTSTGSKEKVYTFGHSSVDAVFNRFLHNFAAAPEAAAHDEGIKSASNSLYEEIKALECNVNALMQNKKRNVGGISLDSFEEIEHSSTSVQELEDVVESLESLLGRAKNKLMNNSTGDLAISNIVASKSDDFFALEFKPHNDFSSSLGDDRMGQNSAIVEYNSANYSDPYWTADGSTSTSGIDFSGEVDIDRIWNLLQSSDFSFDSENVNDCTTLGIASESTNSGSQANEDNVFPMPNLGPEFFQDIKFVNCGTYNTTPDSDFGDINQRYAMDGDFNAEQHDSAGEFGVCLTDLLGLTLLAAGANKFED